MFKNYYYDIKDPSDKHSFEVYDVDLAIINGIRRIILTDIPIPGIIGEEEPTVEEDTIVEEETIIEEEITVVKRLVIDLNI